MRTIGLLLVSNIFIIFEWYRHLKYTLYSLLKVILISWGIVFLEYCFMVPANRTGDGHYNAFQLKTIQEVISLVVFSLFAIVFLKKKLQWNYFVGFALIVGAVFFILKNGNS